MGAAALPRGWTKHVKSSVLHAIALATTALMVERCVDQPQHLDQFAESVIRGANCLSYELPWRFG